MGALALFCVLQMKAHATEPLSLRIILGDSFWLIGEGNEFKDMFRMPTPLLAPRAVRQSGSVPRDSLNISQEFRTLIRAVTRVSRMSSLRPASQNDTDAPAPVSGAVHHNPLTHNPLRFVFTTTSMIRSFCEAAAVNTAEVH